jgi:RNA polymerase sigma factor (sigma-70 family)
VEAIMKRSEFAAAYEKGYRSTVRFLLSTGIPAEAVDDIAQTAWLRGWERRGQLREPQKIVSWINRISLNLFRNQLRRPHADMDACSSHRAPSTVAIDVHRALSACVREDRELLEQYYLEGYTSEELGRRQHCPPGTVRVRALRARRRFLDRLSGGGPRLSAA